MRPHESSRATQVPLGQSRQREASPGIQRRRMKVWASSWVGVTSTDSGVGWTAIVGATDESDGVILSVAFVMRQIPFARLCSDIGGFRVLRLSGGTSMMPAERTMVNTFDVI